MTGSPHPRIANSLAALFRGYDGPAFAIRLWDGFVWSSSPAAAPACTIVVHSPAALRSLLLDPSQLTLGEAFLYKQIDVEGDLFSVFEAAEHLVRRPLPLRRRVLRSILAFGQSVLHDATHSRRRDRASIAYHYDQPLDFFRPWLGPTLVYSCACFESPSDSLEDAQERKLDLICRKLRLQPNQRFLDIGCGWGSLIVHAAARRHADAWGITLSRQQAATVEQRIDDAGLTHTCHVCLRDYRDLDPAQTFDKIASVGMSEHVGLRNLPLYFRIAHRLLKPGGVFLNHAIARASHSAPRGTDSFIRRYVFPDGDLVTVTQAIAAAESAGFEVRDVENLREHYEITLRRWVEGLRRHQSTLLRQVPETTFRIWLLYMAGCAEAFHRGDIGVYQVLLSRPDRGASRLPLTRADWYQPAPSRVSVESLPPLPDPANALRVR
jgi:cyclopropane-fatty-acyl-phospholipid synthase